jgi:hypothetical protein
VPVQDLKAPFSTASRYVDQDDSLNVGSLSLRSVRGGVAILFYFQQQIGHSCARIFHS